MQKSKDQHLLNRPIARSKKTKNWWQFFNSSSAEILNMLKNSTRNSASADALFKILEGIFETKIFEKKNVKTQKTALFRQADAVFLF